MISVSYIDSNRGIYIMCWSEDVCCKYLQVRKLHRHAKKGLTKRSSLFAYRVTDYLALFEWLLQRT